MVSRVEVIGTPTTTEAVSEPVVAAMAEAEAGREQRAYKQAERKFLKSQRELAKVKLDRTMSDEEVKAMRRIFCEHFKDTGEFLRDEAII